MIVEASAGAAVVQF